MEQTYRLGEVEEVLSELDLIDVPDDILESEEDYQIVISGWWVHIPELALNLHEGIFCNYDKEEQAYCRIFLSRSLRKKGKKNGFTMSRMVFSLPLLTGYMER